MLDFDAPGLNDAIASLDKLQQLTLKETFERFYQDRLRQIISDRYDRAAQTTPYAPASLGRKKRSGVVRGGANDPGFGLDTFALKDDLTSLFEVTDESLAIWSDRPYAERIMELFSVKGPFAPDDVLAVEETDLLTLEDELMDAIAGVFDV